MFRAEDLSKIGTGLSSYAKKLPQENPNCRKRYAEKIKIIRYNDPYLLKLTADLPTTVTTGHVVDYLINFKSPYTGDPVRNIRSLEAYRKFEGGFIQTMKGRLIENHYVVVGKVSHSMRLNEKPLNPWIIVEQGGTIISAHCDCTAGISETCSHVSAVLYALANLHAEATDRKITVTGAPAYWKQPPKRVKDDIYKQVKDLDYGKRTKRFYDTNIEKTREDFVGLLELIQQDGDDAAIFASHCDNINFTCPQCSENRYPNVVFLNKSILLQNNFNVMYEGKEVKELRTLGNTLKLSLTCGEIEMVERLTRKQHQSDLWRWVRIGRITASILKEVVHTSNEFPPPKRTLLKRICHPYNQKNISTPAVLYGKQKEPIAKRELERRLKKEHRDLHIQDCGIFIDGKDPFMAASPDCLIQCSCCGTIPAEIKCPYRLDERSHLDQQLTLKDLAKSKDPFIRFDGNTPSLVETHAYFYQMQAQIFLTGSTHGIFMVWSKRESIIIKVPRNKDLWQHCLSRSRLYFKNIIAPELLSNHYTANA